MRPFIINDEIKEKLAALALHAQRNPFSMDEMLDIVNKEGRPAGDYKEFTIEMPFGYRLVYSVENQVVAKIGHLSMSVDADGKLPSVEVVKECMEMLGFKDRLEECRVVLEDIAPNRQAINVLEIIEVYNKR